MKKAKQLFARLVLLTLIGTAAGLSVSSPAYALNCWTPAILAGQPLPSASYNCSYPTTQTVFAQRQHIFIVKDVTGTVWYNYQTSVGGPWNGAWISLGGVARSSVGVVHGSTGGQPWMSISVVGTDGFRYCKAYNSSRAPSAWWPSQSTWALGNICA